MLVIAGGIILALVGFPLVIFCLAVCINAVRCIQGKKSW